MTLFASISSSVGQVAYPLHKAGALQEGEAGRPAEEAQQQRHGGLAEVVVARPQQDERVGTHFADARFLQGKQRVLADRVADVVDLSRRTIDTVNAQ